MHTLHKSGKILKASRVDVASSLYKPVSKQQTQQHMKYTDRDPKLQQERSTRVESEQQREDEERARGNSASAVPVLALSSHFIRFSKCRTSVLG